MYVFSPYIFQLSQWVLSIHVYYITDKVAPSTQNGETCTIIKVLQSVAL